MSITKQTTAVRAAAPIMYAHFGRPADVSRSRAAAWRSDFRGPYDAIKSIESMLKGSGRKNQALMVIQSFSKDELDPRDPMTPMIVADAAYALAKEVAPNSPCDVVVHLDSDGGNPHAHITIANVDLVTGKAARENGLAHWVLKKANDKIMREMGLQVLEPHELAHDVNRSRSGKSAGGLAVDQLDKSTWREFLADRVDEAIQDSRSVDFDSLRAVARELGVSIEKKTSAKSEAEGRDPSVTYALVDDNGEVRRFGRSKAACTARKLGADYDWNGLHTSMEEARVLEKELENVQSYSEDEREFSDAIVQLRESERDQGVVAYHRTVADEDERATGGNRTRDESIPERGPLADANLGELAAQLIRERRERDQEDVERARRDSERQASREAERRKHSDPIRSASAFDDKADQRTDDGPDFDF